MVSFAAEPVLLLRSCDGEVVTAKRATAKHSLLLENVMELQGDSSPQIPILVPGATSAALTEALLWADAFYSNSSIYEITTTVAPTTFISADFGRTWDYLSFPRWTSWSLPRKWFQKYLEEQEADTPLFRQLLNFFSLGGPVPDTFYDMCTYREALELVSLINKQYGHMKLELGTTYRDKHGNQCDKLTCTGVKTAVRLYINWCKFEMEVVYMEEVIQTGSKSGWSLDGDTDYTKGNNVELDAPITIEDVMRACNDSAVEAGWDDVFEIGVCTFTDDEASVQDDSDEDMEI
jgi:hypothetical protein